MIYVAFLIFAGMSFPVQRRGGKMFLFKKVVGPFFDPLSVCIVLSAVGLIMLWFTKRQKPGKVLVSIGFMFLVFTSFNWFSERFILPLESMHPALLEMDKVSGTKWVVVLGHGVAADKKLPVNTHLSSAALARFIEGITIHKALPDSKLILSGGLASENVSEAEAMARTASSLGVDRLKMILDAESKDTEDQARLIKRIVGNDAFILVTTASHMPRSVALAKKLGLSPIPAPVDHTVKSDRGRNNPGKFFPKSQNIMRFELAIHEYLGIAWAKLRGRI